MCLLNRGKLTLYVFISAYGINYGITSVIDFEEAYPVYMGSFIFTSLIGLFSNSHIVMIILLLIGSSILLFISSVHFGWTMESRVNLLELAEQWVERLMNRLNKSEQPKFKKNEQVVQVPVLAEPAVQSPVILGFKPKKDISKSEMVQQFVQVFIQQYKRLPTINECLNNTDASKGLISGALNQYIRENQAELLRRGLINSKRLEMANKSQLIS